MDVVMQRRDAEIVRAMVAGEGSATEIGQRHGLTGQRVGQILKRDGARIAGRIHDEWRAGATKGQIGHRWSLAVGEIDRILRDVVAAVEPEPVRSTTVVPRRFASLAPTRVIGWSAFGPDVEHADPAIAAADARPWRGGRYPKAPSPPSRSLVGSMAALCAEGVR